MVVKYLAKDKNKEKVSIENSGEYHFYNKGKIKDFKDGLDKIDQGRFKVDMDLGEYSYGADNRTFHNFNRFRLIDNQDPLQTNIGYVFFTKTDMSFNDSNTVGSSTWINSEKDSYLNMMANSSTSNVFGQYILSNLSYSYKPTSGTSNKVTNNFMPILSNAVLNFDSIDNQLKTNESFTNYYGIKIVNPEHMLESVAAGTISFNFREYADMRVTHLFKVWVEYIHNVRLGKFVPTEEHRKNKVIDYANSIYYFLLGPDGHEIIYYCKLTACYPINIPYSALSWQFGGGNGIKELNVQFQYQFKEDMNPEILDEFNKITIGTPEIGDNVGTVLDDSLEKNWGNTPFIDKNGKLQFI